MISSSSSSSFFFFFFFFLIICYATPLSFNLPYIASNDSLPINFTGDAYVSIQGIQVTPDPDDFSDASSLQWKTGRATYAQPLHLWDNASRILTDFSTNFSFVIHGTNYGEGLAFFLAPTGSNIPAGSAGGGLALVNENQTTVALGDGRFVAVEFDTYRNTWEAGLPINHVGININSRTSVGTEIWQSNITYGKTNEAWIKYNSSTKNLSVSFTGFINDNILIQNLYYIVDLRVHLPEWVTFGFSASTGESYEKNSVKSWEFTSSLDEDEKAGEKSKTGLAVGLSVGLAVLVAGIALVWFGLWKRGGRARKEDEEPVIELARDQSMDDEFKKGTGARKFSYEELALATKDFSEEEKLGAGGFGGVYRGFLRELNSFVAVKRVSRGSKQGLKEYASEVKIISQLRHRNLVRLFGWCHDKGELLLVYEFMPNGSLDSHLFKGKSALNWEKRYRIAQGLASALLYLHEECEHCVLHRDIKSSNLMLDSNFNAKLGDFGLARIVDHEKDSPTTVLAGTMGYMSPECLATGRSSKESDVYSFGVVALEIACGRRPIEPHRPVQNQVRMVEWVWEMYGLGKVLEAADRSLSGTDDYDDERQIERLMIVGLWCAHPHYDLRPSIRQVTLVLNFEASLPVLPAKMPTAPTSFASSFSSSYYGRGIESSQVQSSSYSDNAASKSSNFPSSSAVSSSSGIFAHTT